MVGEEGRAKWWRLPIGASGIVRLKSGFLPRPGGPPRRKLPRPPLVLSLALLAAGTILSTAAVLHRRALDSRFDELTAASEASPFEIKRLREDLGEQELDERALSAELDARLQYARSQMLQDFYILLDTKSRRFVFKYGDKVVREGRLDVGAPRSIRTKSGEHWTFAGVTGAFSVEQKLENADWTVPAWVYAMNGRTPPSSLPTVPSGLGAYVLVFSGSYAIHSPPAAGSPLQGVKPGSFMVPEPDLAAIWRRVGTGTRIYVF
jgi:hypothetical protein